MTLLGIHILHTWSKWESAALVMTSYYFQIVKPDYKPEIVPGQKRHCLECGLEEIRAIN